MDAFLERLIQERKDLNGNYEKLGSFLNNDKVSGIDPAQSALLRIQHNAMRTYLSVLDERIALLLPDVSDHTVTEDDLQLNPGEDLKSGEVIGIPE